MSKPGRARYRLAEVHAQYAEAVGGDDVEFEGPGGEVFTMPHPLFADDEWGQAVDAEETGAGKARAMLGDEQFDRFIKAGGRPADVNLLFGFLTSSIGEQVKGVKVRPTRS
ncbi:hypothetical protein [Streptomyces tremellae]|uniref:Tail assembly chaperone n=1 Tax=Streptomyces tremellae TaxID=1124239 RepID=A0ABP7EYC8_9ACTN